jgi:hypothetical protein
MAKFAGNFDGKSAGAKEAAEKVGRRMKMRPSAAKAAPVFNRLCTG